MVRESVVREYEGFAICFRKIPFEPLKLVCLDLHPIVIEMTGVEEHAVVVAHIKRVVQRREIKELAQVVIVEVLPIVISHRMANGGFEFFEVPERAFEVNPVELGVRISNVVLTEIAELRDERDVDFSIKRLGEIEENCFREVAHDSIGAFIETAWAEVTVSYDGEFHGFSSIQSPSEP